jgi:hypothetical protein
VKAGTKVVSSAEAISAFNKKLIFLSFKSKLHEEESLSLKIYDPVVAKCMIKAHSSSNILGGLKTVVECSKPADMLKNLKFKSLYLSLQKEVNLMSKENGGISYPFLFFNGKDESAGNEFVCSLTRMKPYFLVMLEMVKDDFVNSSRLLLFDLILPFIRILVVKSLLIVKVAESLKSMGLKSDKLIKVLEERVVLVKRMYNFYSNDFNEKEAAYLVGDPAQIKREKLHLNSFDSVFFYENLKHRIHSETFKIAEPRLDVCSSKSSKLAAGMGDFVVKFKGDNELTYCEGKTRCYSKLAGCLTEENYSEFEESICKYVKDKLGVTKNNAPSGSVEQRVVGDGNNLEEVKKRHSQLAYHIGKGRQVAYFFNFPSVYTEDPELPLSIEEKLNEELKGRLPPRGTIKLACSRLDDKIIQSENLD